MTGDRWSIVKNKWQEMRSRGEEHLWENDYMMNNVLRDFKLCCSKAGIRTTQKLNIHGMRRAYATNLANAGTPAQTLMKLCGHSDIKTTMDYYLKSSDANEQRAVEALDEMMRGEVG
jgi:integrase